MCKFRLYDNYYLLFDMMLENILHVLPESHKSLLVVLWIELTDHY